MSFLNHFKTERIFPVDLCIGDLVHTENSWWSVYGLKYEEDLVLVAVFSEFGDTQILRYSRNQDKGLVCIKRTCYEVEPTLESTATFIREIQCKEWFD